MDKSTPIIINQPEVRPAMGGDCQIQVKISMRAYQCMTKEEYKKALPMLNDIRNQEWIFMVSVGLAILGIMFLFYTLHGHIISKYE